MWWRGTFWNNVVSSLLCGMYGSLHPGLRTGTPAVQRHRGMSENGGKLLKLVPKPEFESPYMPLVTRVKNANAVSFCHKEKSAMRDKIKGKWTEGGAREKWRADECACCWMMRCVMGPNLLSAQHSARSVLWMWIGDPKLNFQAVPPYDHLSPVSRRVESLFVSCFCYLYWFCMGKILNFFLSDISHVLLVGWKLALTKNEWIILQCFCFCNNAKTLISSLMVCGFIHHQQHFFVFDHLWFLWFYHN